MAALRELGAGSSALVGSGNGDTATKRFASVKSSRSCVNVAFCRAIVDQLAPGSGAGGSSVRSKVRTTCLVDVGTGLLLAGVEQLVSRPAVRPPCASAPITPATPFAM